MAAVLILNFGLMLMMLGPILAIAVWAIVHSHHEGRPIEVAGRREWRRHTISLHSGASHRLGRPFALQRR